jgi:DNA-binding NarL/FixJ family response regulator
MSAFSAQNLRVKTGISAVDGEQPTMTVLVAVASAQVREALVAMLGAVDGFQVVADVGTDEAALEAARRYRPALALIESELAGCGGWWAIQQIGAQRLAGAVVALGRRADSAVAQLLGAQCYLQMGSPPRDLLSALQAAVAFRTPAVSGAQAEQNLLSDADAVLDKPALIDL